jgi:hypothetical protein
MDTGRKLTHISEGDIRGSRHADRSAISSLQPRNGSDNAGSDPIGAALRKIHDAVLDEPLPDDFLDLLDQIDKKISASENDK